MHTIPRTFQTCLTHAVEAALRDAGHDPAVFRVTTLTDGLLADGTPFVFSITEGDDVESGRDTRTDLVALFTPAVLS